MLPGQAFVNTLLAPKGTAAGLEALVPKGMRAVTVDVSESGAMAGLLGPGSHVDVVVTSINREAPEKSQTRTIVQNLTVAAVGQHFSTVKADGEKEMPVARTVTLVVTPRDAQMLDMALSVGRVRLVMRATGDDVRDVQDGVMFTELLGGDEAGFAPPVAPVVAVADTQPAVPQVTITPAPATQPAIVVAVPPAVRVVTLIQGNEERHVAFQESQPVRTSDFTDLPLNNAIPN